MSETQCGLFFNTQNCHHVTLEGTIKYDVNFVAALGTQKNNRIREKDKLWLLSHLSTAGK